MQNDMLERLSDYLDGELPEAERAEIERSLATDPRLRDVLAELDAVRAAAAGLESPAPARDLWPEIAARIRDEERAGIDLGRARERRRTVTFTIPQLAAAAAAVLVVGSAAVWTAQQAGFADGARPTTATVAQQDGAAIPASLQPATVGSGSSDLAIAELERRLDGDRAQLDPSTVRVLEESLATIDRAIDRASRALELDPGNPWLSRHVASAKARKVRLLEKANALAAPRT